jgi:hypothetical protein
LHRFGLVVDFMLHRVVLPEVRVVNNYFGFAIAFHDFACKLSGFQNSDPLHHLSSLAKLRTLDPVRRAQMMADALAHLRHEGTKGSEWKLRVYDWLKFGDHSDDYTLFQWLCCGKTKITSSCPSGHYSQIKRKNHCRLRFLCTACREWDRKRVLEDWKDVIRLRLLSSPMLLGPVERWEWKIPSTPSSPCSRSHLAKFAYWFKDHFAPSIGYSSRGDWIVLSYFDPISETIKATYLGPSVLSSLEYTPTCGPPENGIHPQLWVVLPDNVLLPTTGGLFSSNPPPSPKSKQGPGRHSPWGRPKRVHPTFLLDLRTRREIDLFGDFWKVIDAALDWTVPKIAAIEDLTVSRAYNMAVNYKGARLNVIRGVQTSAMRKALLDDPELNPEIMIERKLTRASSDLVVYHAEQVVGALPIYDAPNAGGGVAIAPCPDTNCPTCGQHLVDSEESC